MTSADTAVETQSATKRTLQGVVTSNAGDKSATIMIERRIKHPIYGKFIKRSTKLHVHDETNECNKGDTILVEECRPMSKTKSWKSVAKAAVKQHKERQEKLQKSVRSKAKKAETLEEETAYQKKLLWLKDHGEVDEDEPLADAMTDKATIELTSPVKGVVTTLGCEEGDTFPVGGDLVILKTEGNAPQSAPAPTSAASNALLWQLDE